MKFGPNRATSLISLLHLPRFYVEIKSASSANMKRIIESLRQFPSGIEAATLQKKFGKHIFKNMNTPLYQTEFEVFVSLAVFCFHMG